MTLTEIWTRSTLPRHEVLALAAAATGLRRERLLADPDLPLPADAADRLHDSLARREAGEPLAYLVGSREFFGRLFGVDAHVLIPRADTELLVEVALDRLRARPDGGTMRLAVLEMGTGSGVLAITLALEMPMLDVVATDLSAEALRVARRNAALLEAPVRFVESDWYAFLEAQGDDAPRFDLILSNPPYIAAGDAHLAEGDLRFEPRAALTDGADGSTALRHIVAGGMRHLAAGGVLMLEHGYDQAAQVRAAMTEAGYGDVHSVRDLAGIERVCCGTRDAGGRPGNAEWTR